MLRGSGQASRWRSAGRHRVLTADVGSWEVPGGGTVAVLARYPAPEPAGAPLPVVVLCHGLGGSHRSYAALGMHLASHGYAVLHPRFLDSFEVARVTLGLTGTDERTWTMDERARGAMLGLLFDRRHWLSRVARVHGVIDSLAGQRHLPVPLRAREVIVAGHSYGAYTAQLVLGTRLLGVGLDAERLAHPAAAGGILLSPQGSGDRGLTSRSWDAVTWPLLVVTATGDRGPHGEGLAWRREPFDAAPARPKYLAIARGGTHLLGGIALTERDEGGPGEERPLRAAVLAVTAAFADSVHGDLAAGQWLASGPFPTIFEHEHREPAA